MTPNEARILTLLARGEPRTKREISASVGISWSTTVKLVSRLEQRGFVVFSGRPPRKNVQGVDSAAYSLNPCRPTAIGIDVGYGRTTVVLANLLGTVLHDQTFAGPRFGDVDAVSEHVLASLAEFEPAEAAGFEVSGCGVVTPSFSEPSPRDVFSRLQSSLAPRMTHEVSVDRNVRGYALYRRHAGSIENTSVLVTIRVGVGLVAMVDGEILTGVEGMAGEIGHIPVPGANATCRCGQRGCLETVLNQRTLEEDFFALRPAARGVEPAPVSALMNLVVGGDGEAYKVLSERADVLAQALVPVLLVLDIPDIHLAAEFGPSGAVFAELVSRALRARLSRRIRYRIEYTDLGRYDFAVGATHLILRRFYSDKQQ